MTTWQSESWGEDRDPITAWAEQMHEMVDEYASNLREITRFERFSRPDSYPTGSLGGGGGPSNEIDDDGTPVPQVSDPVARAVIERSESLERSARRAAENAGRFALSELNRGNNAMLKVLKPVREKVRNDRADKTWCTNHVAVGAPLRAATRDDGLCNRCRQWKADPGLPGEYPNKKILEYLDVHKNLTENAIVAAYRADPPKSSKKGKKGRRAA